MDHILKLKYTLDALFGRGVSNYMPAKVDVTFSRRTGRIRTVMHEGKLLCTLRIDGGLALSLYFAQMLLVSRAFRDNCCVEVNADAAPFVARGRSVFCKHVIHCGKNIKISSDVPVIFEGRVIAIGRAILSYSMITDFKRGSAVKIRNSLKSSIVNVSL